MMNTNNMDSKMKKILIFISFCIFAVASCTESYEAHYDFGFDREELRFAAKDTASYFMIYGEGSWTLSMSKEVSWLNMDKLSGGGNTQINVRVQQNEGVARDVEVIARYQDGREKTLIISQLASSSSNKAYTLSASKLDLLKMQRSFKIPATPKFAQESLGELSYWVEYDSEDKDWIENLQFNYSDIEFSVKENDSATERTASIYWTFPAAHWETPDTLSVVVNQTSSLPLVGLEASYNIDPAGLDSLRIYPVINWNTDIYDFDLSNFNVEGVTGEYVHSENYLALITGYNVSGQPRSFNLAWSILENGEEIAKSTTELVQENFTVSISINDTYSLDPEGLDSLKIYPVINWDPSVFDFDLSDFTVSAGVTGKYVKSENYLALVAQPNTSRQTRNFDLKWNVMDDGKVAASTSATLVQSYYIPPVDLTAGGKYANCYVLSDVEEGYYSLDVLMVSGVKPAEDMTSAAVLWESSPGLVTRCSYDQENNRLYVGKAKNAKGNAVIKLMDKAGKIRWSYHFWMTSTGAPVPEIKLGGITFLDRNIGAVANTAPAAGENDPAGTYYQWGRKDPFPAPEDLKTSYNGQISDVYPSGTIIFKTAQDGVTLDAAIQNPATYYWGNSNKNAQDWSDVSFDGYWDTESKTDFDPCPYGYVVPDKSQIDALIGAYSGTAASYGYMLKCDDGTTNYLCSGGWIRRKLSTTSECAHTGQHPHYWSTTTADGTETSGDAKTAEEKKYKGAYATDKITAVTLYPRRWGANVRCVKDTKIE